MPNAESSGVLSYILYKLFYVQVVVTDPEPLHSVMEDSSKDMELKVSATCDYIKYQCDTAPIRFKDTMLYQTRVYK